MYSVLCKTVFSSLQSTNPQRNGILSATPVGARLVPCHAGWRLVPFSGRGLWLAGYIHCPPRQEIDAEPGDRTTPIASDVLLVREESGVSANLSRTGKHHTSSEPRSGSRPPSSRFIVSQGRRVQRCHSFTFEQQASKHPVLARIDSIGMSSRSARHANLDSAVMDAIFRQPQSP